MAEIDTQLTQLYNEFITATRGESSETELPEISSKISTFLEVNSEMIYAGSEDHHTELEVIEKMRALVDSILTDEHEDDLGILLNKIVAISGKLQSLGNKERCIHNKIPPEISYEYLTSFLEDKEIGKLRSAGAINKKDMEKALCQRINQNEATLKGIGCKTIEDALGFIQRNGEDLKTLHLRIFRSKINNSHLEEIARVCPKLNSLDFRGCRQITDAGLLHLKELGSLQSLDLGRCNQITDAGLLHLKELGSLQSLDLRGCSQITDAGLLHLKGLASLQSLNLKYCNRITDDGIADLRRSMPSL